MSGHVTVGNCPKCGAPIYSPQVWHSILPPPAMHSCGCFPQPSPTYTSNTTGWTP